MAKYKWYCNRCGKCCEHIITNTPIGKFGMFLLPFEVKRFPERYIKPLYGIGRKGRSRKRPAIIYAYQYIGEPCIWYDASTKSCKIYEKRPLVCRQYPLQYSFGTYILDDNCPMTKKVFPDNVLPYLDEIEGIEVEKDALRKIHAYYVLVFLANMYKTNVLITWYYDLETMKWKRFNLEYALKIIEELQKGVG